MVLEGLADLLRAYGYIWSGDNAPGPNTGAQIMQQQDPLGRALADLASVSRYITVHMFDPLEHTRGTIASVWSAASGSDLSVRERYSAVERLYLALPGEWSRADRQAQTLVQWLQTQVTRTPTHVGLFIAKSEDDLPKSGAAPVVFPLDYCRGQYDRASFGRLDDLTVDRLVETTTGMEVDRSVKQFLAATAKRLGLRAPKDAEAVAGPLASAFYLWERHVGILPYYLRLYSWDLPASRATGVGGVAPTALVCGLSCTFVRARDLRPSHFMALDAIARGIASAVTLLGQGLTQGAVPFVFMPQLLHHEIGGTLAVLRSRVWYGYGESETLADCKTALALLAPQYSFVADRLKSVALFADLNEDIPVRSLVEGSSWTWSSLFAEMLWLPDTPAAMKLVSLTVETGDGKSVTLGCEEYVDQECAKTLEKLGRWPSAPIVAGHYVRGILQNIINNAARRGAHSIVLRLGQSQAPSNYVDLETTDDGDAYLPDVASARIGFGHRLADQLVRSLRRDTRYKSAEFVRPGVGSVGLWVKVFRLRLPCRPEVSA